MSVLTYLAEHVFQIINEKIVLNEDGIKKQFSTNDSILKRLDVSYY